MVVNSLDESFATEKIHPCIPVEGKTDLERFCSSKVVVRSVLTPPERGVRTVF